MNTKVKKMSYNHHKRYKSQNQFCYEKQSSIFDNQLVKFKKIEKIEKIAPSNFINQTQTKSKAQQKLKQTNLNFQSKAFKHKKQLENIKRSVKQDPQKYFSRTELLFANQQIQFLQKQYQGILRKQSEQILKSHILKFLNHSIKDQLCLNKSSISHKKIYNQNQINNKEKENICFQQSGQQIQKVGKQLQKIKHSTNLIDNTNEKLVAQILQLRKTRVQIQNILQKLCKEIKKSQFIYLESLFYQIQAKNESFLIKYSIGSVLDEQILQNQNRQNCKKQKYMSSKRFISENYCLKSGSQQSINSQQRNIKFQINSQQMNIKFKKIKSQNCCIELEEELMQNNNACQLKSVLNQSNSPRIFSKNKNKTNQILNKLHTMKKIYSLLQLENKWDEQLRQNKVNKQKNPFEKTEPQIQLQGLICQHNSNEDKLDKVKQMKETMETKNNKLIQKISYIQTNIQQIDSFKKNMQIQFKQKKNQLKANIEQEQCKIDTLNKKSQRRTIDYHREQLNIILKLLGINPSHSIHDDSISKKLNKLNMIELEVSLKNGQVPLIRINSSKNQNIKTQQTDPIVSQNKQKQYQSSFNTAQNLNYLTTMTNFCKTVKFKDPQNKVEIGKQTLNNIYRNLKKSDTQIRILSKDQFETEYENQRKKRVNSACRRRGLIKSLKSFQTQKQSHQQNSLIQDSSEIQHQ